MSEDPNIEDEIKQLEDDLKKIDAGSSEYGAPEAQKKEGIFKFFREILHIKDSTRVGNLKDSELGTTKLGVRHYQEVALYAEAEKLDVVSKYLRAKANIITSTSMSRKGFFVQSIITNIKKEGKIKEPREEKKAWFGSKKREAEE